MRQHTIRKAVSLEGVGLHSGKTVRVALSPAPADSGIVFRAGEHGEPIAATRHDGPLYDPKNERLKA